MIFCFYFKLFVRFSSKKLKRVLKYEIKTKTYRVNTVVTKIETKNVRRTKSYVIIPVVVVTTSAIVAQTIIIIINVIFSNNKVAVSCN